MLPEGAREAAQAALEAASSWTCSRCQARRQASKLPNCSTCSIVRFHRPNLSETDRKSTHHENQF